MNKELYDWLVEDLWASFGYDSPEHHAEVILKYISDKLITEFLERLHELHRKIIDENIKRNMNAKNHIEYNDHFNIEIEKLEKRLKV